MRTTKPISITLPVSMAAAVKEKVTSGEYASESEVIREGLRALFAQDDAVERWLETEVVNAYDKLRSDSARAVSSKDIRSHLAAARQESLRER